MTSGEGLIDNSVKLLFDAPAGDYTLETHIKIEPDKAAKTQNTWTFIVIFDDTNKPSSNWWYVARGGADEVNTEYVQNGAGIIQASLKGIGDLDVYLKADKIGQGYTGYYKIKKDDQWTLVGKYTHTTLNPLKVGLCVKSWAVRDMIEAALGSSRIGVENLTVIALMPRNLMRDQREFMMPNIMHTLKISDSANLKRKSLLFLMFLAILIAFPFATYFSVRLNYFHPGVKGYAFWEQSNPFHRLAYLIQNPTDTNFFQLTFIAIGAVFMTFLVWMRNTFLWWPLHPIGYAMFSSWATLMLWFSFFLGGLMKFVIVKYGGAKAYRSARPLFLGLALGESFMCGFWNLVGFFTGYGYRIMPP